MQKIERTAPPFLAAESGFQVSPLAASSPNRTLHLQAGAAGGHPSTRQGQIRVLHVVSTFEVKTDTKWLHILLQNFDRQRVEPAIACMYGGGPMQAEFAELGIETANFDARREISLSAVRRPYRYIRSRRFDVVHTHLLRADLYATLSARLAGTRSVISTAYAIGEFRRWKRRRLDGLLDQVARLWPTHLLAVSQAVKDDCVRRLRWPESDVSVIHTGIEPAGYGPNDAARRRIRSEWGLGDHVPLVVTLARLNYEKGLPTLIEAAGIVATHHPSAVTMIVGDGPIRGELKEQISSAGLADRVLLAGFRQDVPDVLAAADVFCLPSYMEGMPNALLEASAAGVPVVATNVGGIPELVVADQTGLLVSPRRSDELADAIGRLISDRPLATRLAAAARRRVEEEFSARAVAEKYQSLYETLVVGFTRRGRRADHHGRSTQR